MARKKPNEPAKPEDRSPVSLLRSEERIERVPITAEQAQERMRAAAAILLTAQELDGELADLKEQVKDVKARAAAKHGEADRIVLDAQSGTMAAPFPVIVERHPSRPLEMNVWRVPDGVAAAEILELPVDLVGEARIAAREAQGCILLEARAMDPDELEQARSEDERRINPELPFEAPAADPSAIEQDWIDAGEPETFESEGHADAKPARPAPACPYILEQPELGDPTRDVICGAVGAPRRKGFCADELTGGKNGNGAQVLALTRRSARQRLAREAAEDVAEGAGQADRDLEADALDADLPPTDREVALDTLVDDDVEHMAGA